MAERDDDGCSVIDVDIAHGDYTDAPGNWVAIQIDGLSDEQHKALQPLLRETINALLQKAVAAAGDLYVGMDPLGVAEGETAMTRLTVWHWAATAWVIAALAWVWAALPGDVRIMAEDGDSTFVSVPPREISRRPLVTTPIGGGNPVAVSVSPFNSTPPTFSNAVTYSLPATGTVQTSGGGGGTYTVNGSASMWSFR